MSAADFDPLELEANYIVDRLRVERCQHCRTRLIHRLGELLERPDPNRHSSRPTGTKET